MGILRNLCAKTSAVLLAISSLGMVNSGLVNAADGDLAVGQAPASKVLAQYDGYVSSADAVKILGLESIYEFWESTIMKTLNAGGGGSSGSGLRHVPNRKGQRWS